MIEKESNKVKEIDEIIELDNFIVKEKVYFAKDNMEDNLSMLLGKYRVLKHIIREDEDYIEGGLFLLHESVADEDTPLNEYPWMAGGYFDYEDKAVNIYNSSSHISHEINEQLADKMVQVMDNVVSFSMGYADYGYKYQVLKQDGIIVGIKVEDLGAWIHNVNFLFNEACVQGDLEKVRYYLHSPDLKSHASISLEDYSAYYWACTRNHKELIKYLLCSEELEEHCTISQGNGTPFIILCNSNPQLVQELIAELPVKKVIEIKEFLNNYYVTNKEELNKCIEMREIDESLNIKIKANKLKR